MKKMIFLLAALFMVATAQAETTEPAEGEQKMVKITIVNTNPRVSRVYITSPVRVWTDSELTIEVPHLSDVTFDVEFHFYDEQFWATEYWMVEGGGSYYYQDRITFNRVQHDLKLYCYVYQFYP